MKLSCLPVSLYDGIFTGKKHRRGLDSTRCSIRFGRSRLQYQILPKARRGNDKQYTRRPRKVQHRAVYARLLLRLHTPRCSATRTGVNRPEGGYRTGTSIRGKIHSGDSRAKPSGTEREAGVRWVTDGFRRALDAADKQGITLAYENHTKGAPWDYWDFSQPTEIFLEILDALSDTPLGVCFDTANPLVLGEDVLGLLEKVMHRIVVLHIFDLRAVRVFEPVRVGTGASPIQAIFSRLRQIDYEGWFSIEEASRSGVEGFEQSIVYVQNAWEHALSA